MTERKFRIVLGSSEYMKANYPLAKQQEIVNNSELPVFFCEAEGPQVQLSDVVNQIDRWNRDNIEEILLEGPTDLQLTFALPFNLLVLHEDLGVPVFRGQDNSEPSQGYYF